MKKSNKKINLIDTQDPDNKPINNKNLRWDENELNVSELKASDYQLIVESDGYETIDQNIAVKGETKETIHMKPKTFSLTFEIPDIAQGRGSYSVTMKPYSTASSFDTTYTFENESGTNLTITGIPMDEYSITFDSKIYRPIPAIVGLVNLAEDKTFLLMLK